MEYRILGRTGIKVSRLCFGTMTFGREADEATSIKMYHRCRDAGINFFDTADCYGAGTSETILGKCIAEGREKIILSTKVGNPVGDDVNDRGLSRRHIRLSVEKSLKRLGTDYIDLYFLHSYDPKTSIEETLSVLKDLQSQGKVLYIGASNWSAWQIAKAIGLSELKRFLQFECIQPMYNLVKRQAEVEIFPLAKQENLGVITYNSLAGGLLTGKYINKDNLLQGRILEDKLYERRYANPAYYEIAEKLVSYAKDQGFNPAALAVAWVMSNPVVTAPIIGARNLKQLEQTLAALEIEMTPKMRKEISTLSITPPEATDR